MPPSGPRWRDPLVAVAAVLVAFALRWSLRPAMGGSEAPLQMFFLAVFVAAWAGGLLAGLFATALSVGIAYFAFFQHPAGPFSLATPDVLRIGVFLAIGTVFSVMSESRLRALEREAERRRELQAEQERRASALSSAAEQRE